MEAKVPSRILKRWSIGTAIFVSLAGLLAELGRDRSQFDDSSNMLIGFVSLSYEQNLPTWFSSHLIFLCAVMLAVISFSNQGHGAQFRRHWRGLAFIFAYISLDEAVEIHEGLNFIFETSGVLYFAWIVPFGLLLLMLAIAYQGFLRQLPRPVRRRFILSGGLYVGGALVMELPLGYWTDLYGDENLTYAMLDWVEESLEICGMLLFAFSLASFMTRPDGSLRLRA